MALDTIFARQPTNPYTQHEMRRWREQVVLLTSRITFWLALPLNIFGTLNLLLLQAYWRIPLNFILVMLLGVIAYYPALSFRRRVVLLFSIYYLTATIWLAFSGLAGIGRSLFFLIIVLAALIFEGRTLFVFLASVLLTQAFIYSAFFFGIIPIPYTVNPETIFTPFSLSLVWVSQLILSIAVAVAIISTLNTLRENLYKVYLAETERVLQASEERYRAIWETATDAIVVVDRQGLIRSANPSYYATYGFTPEQVIEQPFTVLLPESNQQPAWPAYTHMFTEEHPALRHEIVLRHADGSERTIEAHLAFLMEADERVALIGVLRDITERKAMERELHQSNAWLREQSIRDPLTHLHNRRYLDERLPQELQRAAQQQLPVGIIVLDIDRFKNVNDTYGHDCGDELLQTIGAFLRGRMRSEDIVCRYGGEEFVIVLLGATTTATHTRAEDLRLGLHTLVVQNGPCQIAQITASFGVAVCPQHGTSADALFRAADQALYAAKQGGRDQVVIAPLPPPSTIAASPAADGS
ncbi:MAG: diguanylate cyclase [Chloroflexaceae bacterium]|nr:diguanylate cyclase [Chloroflexaceae bacterium]